MSYAAKLQIISRLLKIPEPIPEYYFHKPRRWRFDFAWWFCDLSSKEEIKLALEVEGEIFGTGKKCFYCGVRPTGGHSSVTGILRDMEKYNQASLDGWTVLRVLPAELELEDGKAIMLLEFAFNKSREEKQ